MNPECFYLTNLFLNETCFSVLQTQIGPANSTFLYYLFMFALTCFLESPFYVIYGRLQKLPVSKILLQIFILNLATHPMVHFGLASLGSYLHWTILTYLLVAEAFAFVFEILLLRYLYLYSWNRAFAASTTANLCSWSVGVWLLENQIL